MDEYTDDQIEEWTREFLSGVGVAVGIFGVVFVVYLLLNVAANWLDAQPTPKEQRFEVVDTYKKCEVVRYNPDGSARYSYFLDCK